ncbi:hypothetical protein FLA_0301 [Filimonas lacunae]|nr:hypothetical protein FLA_0301 [Filimonas lacunae]
MAVMIQEKKEIFIYKKRSYFYRNNQLQTRIKCNPSCS